MSTPPWAKAGDRPRSGPRHLAPSPEKKAADGGLGFLKELPILILVALAIALLIKTFVVQAFYIPSGSMEDTLLINDRVLVSKFVYRFTDPKPGNIVVFVAPGKALVHTLSAVGDITGFNNYLKEGLCRKSNQREFIKRVVTVGCYTVKIK